MIHRISRTGLLLALLLLSAAGAQPAQPAPEHFQATIVDMAQAVSGSSTSFILRVERWGSEEETLAYLQTLKDKGQDGLLKSFREAKESGWVRIGSQLGYPIIFARVIPTPEGRIVRAFTDRPLQFFEVRNNLRSVDYPFGIVELKFNAKGKGEGTLVAAASAKFDDKGQLEIEQYGTRPFKLLNVQAKPVKEKEEKKK